VLSCFVSLVEFFYDDTLGTAFKSPPDPLRRFRTSHFTSLLGIECDEEIHSILDVMYANAPYTVIQRAMHIHPTVTELIPTMLGELKPLE
jgi:hypothetical protein